MHKVYSGGKNMQKYRPGETCMETGNYAVYNEHDEKIGSVYLKEEQTFPPTQYEGSYYEKED